MVSVQVYNKELANAFNNWASLSKSERDALFMMIDSELESGNYPFYLSETEVVLVSKNEVKLIGDNTGWINPIEFKQLDGTNKYFLKLQLEPDARIQYLLIHKDEVSKDPYNKFVCRHGLGEMSELAMPLYNRHPYTNDFIFGSTGNFERLERHIIPAGVLTYEHEVFVYFPAGYSSNNKYPVIYFQDGPDYVRFALAANTLNRLIKENLIQTCIAVFVTPPNLHEPEVPNRSTEYGLNDDYVKFFCDELVPFVDNLYSTKKYSENRLVIGDSYGGLISTYIAFSRSEVFMNVYSQSGFFSFNNYRLPNLVKESETKPINLFIDIGTYEKIVGADFISAAEQDFTSANRIMKKILEEKKYSFVYKEYHEGHTWGNWRRHLIDALIHFLGNKGVMQ